MPVFVLQFAGRMDRRAGLVVPTSPVTSRKGSPGRTKAAMRRWQGQLQSLAAKLNAAREAERTRLARELHDDLGQTLTSLKLELLRMLKMVDWSRLDPSTLDRAQSLIGLTEISLETTRRIATSLRPPTLDHLGLAEAIRWEASLVQARTGIRCHYVVRGNTLQLSDDRATGVFRIFQEAVTNVLRHARARALEIRVSRRGDELLVFVRDDGQGFDPGQLSAQTRTLGLHGMRERAQLVGGSLQVLSVPGVGTTVLARLLLHEGEPAA